MLFLFWLVLCLLGAFLILLPSVLWFRILYSRNSGGRLVTCPETHRPAVVSLDAKHAAATGLHGLPQVRLCGCTRWPEHAPCGQGCLAEAVQAGPWTLGSAPGKTKPIHHLPVVLAAFVAWCVGAIWHAQYLFRPRLTQAIGLTRAEMKQMVWWISPHLLTAAVLLLFAYGVAWLLTLWHRKGVLPGLLMAVVLCGAVVAASAYDLVRLPHDLLVIEAGYVALAVLIVGAIVGGLYDKLVMPGH